jgi:5'-nucleotidase / UDP-sugar diphosphatase
VNGRRSSFLAAAAAYLLLAAGVFWAGSASRRAVRLAVIHTNDVHGWILPHMTEDGPVGGFAAFAAFLSRQPKPYLLLDAGDVYQGTPEGTLTKGEAVVDGMGALGYDAAAVGNHEFDDGVDNLARLTEAAGFPFLSANVRDAEVSARRPAGRLDRVKPWILKEVSGVKVGVFGLTSADTPKMSFAKNVADVEFSDEAEAAREAVRELRAQGADVVVALTHIGWEEDQALARAVDGIDLIVGGHSHTRLRGARKVGGTYIVQAGSQLWQAGRVVLEWDPRKRRLRGARARLVSLDAARWGEDANVKSLAAYYSEAASSLLGEPLDAVVGELREPLTRSYTAESPMGDWHTDALRAASGADIAVYNSGGIRNDLPAGPVTVRDLYQVAPFGNTLVTLKMRGEDVRALLEHGVGGGHGLLQVSGVRLVYDPGRPAGERVREVSAGDGPLERNRVYKVATNNFLAQGGEGYDAFREGWEVRDTGRTVLDVLIADLKSNSPLPPPARGRIVTRE